MRVFLDTNIFTEYFEQRKQIDVVRQILNKAEDKEFEIMLSSGSLYTLAYILRFGLKKKGIYRPEQTKLLRNALNTILEIAKVVDISHESFYNGVND